VAAQYEHEARVDLTDEVTSARRARHWLTDHLEEWGLPDVAPTAELLVSELVTNAVRHAGTTVEVTALVHDHRLRVEVHDEGEGEPQVERPGTATMGGRGLMIVESVAEDWGWTEDGDGKVVWFELPLDATTGF
jgi:anti-sigma regulatory factor (Ser/Thr protein kinase)